MRRLSVAVALSGLLLAACSDPVVQPSNPKDQAVGVPSLGPSASCPVIDPVALRADLAALFVASSPDENSALGKFDNILHQLSIGDQAQAKNKTWNLIDFLLLKRRQGSLVAASADLAAVVNALFCLTGINATFGGNDGWIVYPNDASQVLVTEDGWAGTALPASVVTEPTLISIDRIDEVPFPTGGGPLSTTLDQYPLYYDFNASNDGGTGFNQPVIVGVCPANGVDPSVLPYLRLGHDASFGFEITPPAAVNFLDCSNAPSLPSSSAAGRLLQRVGELAADLLLPTKLQASFFGGGIGGSAIEFSPFGPVDSRVTGSGGIGGSATEFAPSLVPGTVCDPNGAGIEAPVGTGVPESCRPQLTLTTPLGTPLTNVPVTFSILSGAGAVAPELNALCGSFDPSSTIVATGAQGVSRACWRLGLAAGANTVEGRPAPGGDAPPGVVFQPPAFVFTAEANPPSQLGFLSGPGTITASDVVPLPPISVAVQDKNGVTVAVSSAPVTLALTSGSFAPGSVTTVNAVNGIGTFGNLFVTGAATGLGIVASSPGLTSATSSAFDVLPAAPTVLTKLAGDNQTVAAGSTVPVPPSVRVSDQYGNPVPGEAVNFVAQNNSALVTGGTQVTDAAGVATVGSWIVLDGPNTLIVSLASNPLVFTTFTATGTSTLAELNACDLGGSGDPVAYPFWTPGSNKAVRQVELYLSSNGAANTPTTYRIRLTAKLDGFDQPVAASSTVDVTLTGKNSQWLPTVFRFASPLVSGNRNTEVAYELQVLSNPDGATLSYNTGPCGLGNCKPPKSCAVTQAAGTTPAPLGTERRKSVAIRILGN
ncbi:MAG: Ig-like domain-containing protein [Gemmatimonadales bacterium]